MDIQIQPLLRPLRMQPASAPESEAEPLLASSSVAAWALPRLRVGCPFCAPKNFKDHSREAQPNLSTTTVDPYHISHIRLRRRPAVLVVQRKRWIHFQRGSGSKPWGFLESHGRAKVMLWQSYLRGELRSGSAGLIFDARSFLFMMGKKDLVFMISPPGPGLRFSKEHSSNRENKAPPSIPCPLNSLAQPLTTVEVAVLLGVQRRQGKTIRFCVHRKALACAADETPSEDGPISQSATTRENGPVPSLNVQPPNVLETSISSLPAMLSKQAGQQWQGYKLGQEDNDSRRAVVAEAPASGEQRSSESFEPRKSS
eukprot:CAMPEP_0177604730 /NCGR_PEP_ID=MMETSP0419_2-20121207/16286_1 /TAXON_ID=582737 /ORGANISM="Tetraselmis sp., Strain GSL018" /LENGTH=312 /DNA_ID=CAMNT_0019098757 /DNA_START=160 /DNA_END=1099 /DNA_ORIENTATION=-